MKTNHLQTDIKRIGPVISADKKRVMLRPFSPVHEEVSRRIIRNVALQSEEETETQLQQILKEFKKRHLNTEEAFSERFKTVQNKLALNQIFSESKQKLIGAYFMHEYSPEAAALFNPSMVEHPDQSRLKKGEKRFVLSLRATGEGHISSIAFRTGIVSAAHSIKLSKPAVFAEVPKPLTGDVYIKDLFERKLVEAGLHGNLGHKILDQMPERFGLEVLREALLKERQKNIQPGSGEDSAIKDILLLAESNYHVSFYPKGRISERILFPAVPSQSNGIEDARFVRFDSRNGNYIYYATYTAYDGRSTLPQLVETKDFISFQFITLNGPAVQNKGMALFPRKINGKYVMLSRQDDENILIMTSDNLHFWQSPQMLLKPQEAWEQIKIGTCGSPIETPEGWIVLSHGVGAMRKYSIGAFLLSLEDPTKVIGRLRSPLLSPDHTEREGYVPNVLYTCGAMQHDGDLIIPYAMSDSAASFAKVSIKSLIAAMQ